MRTGIAELPLHYGKTPRWLFERMMTLAHEIMVWMVSEFGVDELLKRLSDPYWFQAFGCALGFDWHSSGLTTTVCGAIKEGFRECGGEVGLYFAGGKGRTSRKTPTEILRICEEKAISQAERFVYASKMAAKVDNTALQDGYQLYHHLFFFSEDGRWGVIQQGMNPYSRKARRYHWLSSKIKDFVEEPHAAICCDRLSNCLNMVARESGGTREIVAELSREGPDRCISELEGLKTLDLPPHHSLFLGHLNPQSLRKVLLKTYERKPEHFEALLGIEGVGPKTIRALALIGELVYGKAPSWRDPVSFSFAHGGKDGHPYRIRRDHYDLTIQILKEAINRAKIGDYERVRAIGRLHILEAR
jgi:hypothetical protein